MKNIIKIGKRSIAAILTLCILFGIAGTCVYASSVISEETTVVTEETIVATEETTQELVPVTASECYQYWVPDTWNLQYMDQTHGSNCPI